MNFSQNPEGVPRVYDPPGDAERLSIGFDCRGPMRSTHDCYQRLLSPSS